MKIDRAELFDLLEESLGESMHTAWRKGVDSASAVIIHKLISDMPGHDWCAYVDTVLDWTKIYIDGLGDEEPPEKLLSVLDEVRMERKRQDGKWGEQNHHPVYWIGVLAEELGEAAKASIEFRWAAMRMELVHTAAVAVAMIEALDRRAWPKQQAKSQSAAVDVPHKGQE